MKHFLWFALFLTIHFSGFSQDVATQKAYLQDFAQRYTHMYLEEDFSEVDGFYSDSVRLMPEFQPTVLSKQHAAAYFQAFFNRFEVQSYQRAVYEVLDLGSRLIELGTFRITFADTARSYELQGKYFNIWLSRPGEKPKLFTEAWNYDHSVDFAEQLRFTSVPTVKMALEPHLPIQDNISFELAGLNALMERIISEKDGRLWPMFYADDGITFHSFSPMVVERKALDHYFEAHAQEMPVFEKLDVRTDRIDELDGYVIEYATAIANWRRDLYSGISTSKNIRLWKRQANGSLKIYRMIAMYD